MLAFAAGSKDSDPDLVRRLVAAGSDVNQESWSREPGSVGAERKLLELHSFGTREFDPLIPRCGSPLPLFLPHLAILLKENEKKRAKNARNLYCE